MGQTGRYDTLPRVRCATLGYEIQHRGMTVTCLKNPKKHATLPSNPSWVLLGGSVHGSSSFNTVRRW
jgi:hypothetical protein